MKKAVFTAKTLEECLETASIELKISKEKIRYEILEEKKGFFNKKVTIKIIEEKKIKKVKNGTIKTEDGKIIVKNPEENGRAATITPSKSVKILVDGTKIKNRKEVFEDSKIEIVFDENLAERRTNISISPDKMKAYITIKFIPENVYKLKDSQQSSDLVVEIEIKEQKFPSAYTSKEIKKELITKGVKFGIIEEALEKCINTENVDSLLIACGEEPLNGIDDEIKINFDTGNNNKELVADQKGKIDYKSIGYIRPVEKNDILAVKKEGIEGKDGIDINGNVKKHRVAKRYQIKAGEGCEFKDENTVIAAVSGKPSIKGTTFFVHKIHEVKTDVDLKTGNIEFIGDIIIHGSIKEGMQVKAGCDLIVNKHVERAKTYSKMDTIIDGNIINSTINGGGENIIKLNKLKSLEELTAILEKLIETIDHVKTYNILGKEVHDGEVVKVLIENKFKSITQICLNYIKLAEIDENSEDKKIAIIIKQKLIGAAPLSIKNCNELKSLLNIVKENIKMVKGTLSVPVDVKIGYCQESIINSSGNVMITGKGEYVSKITAHANVEFINPTAIARGGMIRAQNEIKCKKVGSEGGVSTKLIIGKNGNIWVEMAYQNTCFVVGGKEYTLDVPSKSIHAYLNKDGELIVDKFAL
nr:flagellar assembly protein A [Clostridium aestuarii]